MIIKSRTWEKNPCKGGGSFQDVTPAASAWLNPTMDDDSSQDSEDLDDAAHIPTATATPAVEMDGEGGENTTTDEITNTGVQIILDRILTLPM